MTSSAILELMSMYFYNSIVLTERMVESIEVNQNIAKIEIL